MEQVAETLASIRLGLEQDRAKLLLIQQSLDKLIPRPKLPS